jgi:HAD superfamily hydrolase (TIGR01509 family)
MIKLIIFDLDGVLVDSKETHYEALNMALADVDPKFVISHDEHIAKYDGLPTNRKLDILAKEKGLPKDSFETVWEKKQQYTFDVINTKVKENHELISLFRELKSRGIQVWVASNSIKKTIRLYLLRLGLMEFVDDFLSNEDVKKSKPNPEMYLKCMVENSVSPCEAVIVEDSQVGITAAIKSGANVIPVRNSSDTNRQRILSYIDKMNAVKIYNKWESASMNILIPMAGAGSRFASAGYTFPKPLIEIRGKPMIQVVVDNLNINATYTYIVRTEHLEKYNLKYLLNMMTPGCNVIDVNHLTEGAACTTLLAEQFINNDSPLLIANSDQFIEWNSGNFMYSMTSGNADGGILTFENSHPKWSYVKTDEAGYVTDLAEKKVISNKATVGIYYWNRGSEYVKYAKQMIAKNIRVNNEFYVAPVYNEAIAEGKKIKIFDIDKMWGIGTPEDLNYFNENYKGNI